MIYRPDDKLIAEALAVKENAYAPHSDFRVGAALLCNDGSIYTGCNVENASYGETICAERVAFFKAISEGKRKFDAIAIAGPDGEATPPCGACRQVMSEFCSQDFRVIMAKGDNGYEETTLGELLPDGFTGPLKNKD